MFKKLIKTQSFTYNLCMIFIVSLLAAIIGLLVYCINDKTTTLDWFNLANSVFKFSSWFMFGYGTLQAFGRRIEHDNIEQKIIKVDQEALKCTQNENSNRQDMNEKSLEVYEEQINELERIENDDKTTVKLYCLGVVVFLLTTLADIILPAFQN
ncbi:hypothetical protein [Gilvimarinus agarilyticus]|uniref:hypothetical protein n=1 Tax=Gilvimarinus agarilyticus TaxID=679259 RepID=UPI0005A22BE8|nr:hypothetical protein [Gilvimarinus agarilyticus]